MKIAIMKLLAGETILEYREGGNSMLPIIRSRQPVTVRPIVDPKTLKKGDIVLCKVNGRVVTHLITAVGTHKSHVQIGNNHGLINGWTAYSNVYGIVTAIDGKPRSNSQYRNVSVQT